MADPFPDLFAPMLPTLVMEPFVDAQWVVEPKLDGFRYLCFADERAIRLVSRNGVDATAQYGNVVTDLHSRSKGSFVIDGEMVTLDAQGRPSFQLMQNRGTKGTQPIYYVLDLLYAHGKDLRGVPFEERRAQLLDFLEPTERIRIVDSYAGEQARALFDAAVSSQLEGIVAKRLDSTYRAGARTRDWLKIKVTQTDDFVIVGYTAGAGSRAGTLGALVLAQYDRDGRLQYTGDVGTGFNRRTIAEVMARLEPLRVESAVIASADKRGRRRWTQREAAAITWVQPLLVAEVRYSERTDDGDLRHPSFLRLRDDKAPLECRQPDPS